MGALEIVVPLRSASALVLHSLAQTVASLAALSLAGLNVTLLLVGEKRVRDSVQSWVSGHAPLLGVRQLDFAWTDNWSVLEVGTHIATPYFALLEPGGQFFWPDDVPLAAVTQF